MTISNEAVEASARAICAAQFPDVSDSYAWNVQFDDGKDEYRAEARAALAAAAPIIRAEALEEAAEEGWQALLDHARATRSVPGADFLRDYLRARAAAERGGSL